MAESVFGDKAAMPNEEQLQAALAESAPLWMAVLQACGGRGEWKFYTKAAGWVYPVKLGKRTLYYMMPKEGFFKLTFVYGPRAVEAAKTAGLPPAVLQALLGAKAYMEGRSVTIEVRQKEDLATAEKMLTFKLEN